jgi:hypothetical protein
MGKRCLCERVDSLLDAQPWFRVLPAAAKWLAWALARRIADAPGLRLPFAGAEEVSLSVSVSVSEVETHLPKLLETGLFARDDAGGLVCPALAEHAARIGAARENGRKGGRPRRGETPEEAARRRQGALLLPVSGGRRETQETPPEPNTESSRGERESLSSTPIPSVSLDARELLALTEELAAVAGMDPARGGYNASPIRAWLAQGATPDLLREVVARVRGRSAAAIGSFRYFDQAVREALASPPPAAAGRASPDDEESPWLKAFEAHRFQGGDPARFPSPAEWYAQHGRAA